MKNYNGKHSFWGSRVITPKGRQLLKATENLKLITVSSGEPTYSPTDVNKTPDLIDFGVVKGIAKTYFSANSNIDPSSDNSPVEILLTRSIILRTKHCRIHNLKTNWPQILVYKVASLNMNVPLKINHDIEEAIEHFNNQPSLQHLY